MPTQDPELPIVRNRTRRTFLTYLPIGIVAGVFGSLLTAAFRFLRPVIASPNDRWIDVAQVGEISGASPISKRIKTEISTGWAVTTEQHNVFVLPANNNQVLSAVCPHEGCEVTWESSSNQFLCPCHESYFGSDGSRVKGPSGRGLDALPSRVQDGKLQVQYRSYDNASPERTTRA